MPSSEQSPPIWTNFARSVIESTSLGQSPATVPPPDSGSAQQHGGIFVTIRKLGQLRGCMGILDPRLPIAEAVRDAAQSAAQRDPRFPPVTPDELPHLRIEVSILSEPFPMQSTDDLELGRHGIIIQQGNRRGLFLPQVATDHHLDKASFLARCCSEKAGLPPDAWRDPGTDILLFTTEVSSET